MKLLKFVPLLLILTFYNSSPVAAKDCDEIKGNIVGKLFCKATNKSGTGLNNPDSDSSSSSEKSGWTFWKKPEWMKKKN